MIWSAEYFRRRDLARAVREKMWGPFERRASKILERIGMPDDSQDEWSGQSYYAARNALASALRWQMYDQLAERPVGGATLDEMRARVAFLRPTPPLEYAATDDIPF